MTTLTRQNYHLEAEAGLNRQINMELYASYVYMSMANYFERDDVALHGFAKFFKQQSDEEREHAEKFMKYQNKRGGRVVCQPIPKPENDEWVNGLTAMEASLKLEKNVNKALLELNAVASRHADPHLSDFIESEFLGEQISSIKQMSDFVSILKRVGPGLGEYEFDRNTLGGASS